MQRQGPSRTGKLTAASAHPDSKGEIERRYEPLARGMS
jgi:hypothetical protein